MAKRPVINPDPLTLWDLYGPAVTAGEMHAAVLETTLLPDRAAVPEPACHFQNWRTAYADSDPNSDDFLRMSIGYVYSPLACPACRLEAAGFLSEEWDQVERFPDIHPAALEDLEGRVAWIEHRFQPTEHVCEWAPYQSGMKVRSPVRWAGGKSRVAQKIVSLLPPHDTFVEVFAGGASVFFAKPPVRNEVLNDIDPDVMNFFQVVKEMPWELAAEFAWCLVSRKEFQDLAAMDPVKIDDPVQRAYRFYYLLMAGWGGETKSPRFSFCASDGAT